MITGVALLLTMVVEWGQMGFGRMDYPHTMRWVIPGMTLTALGFQTVLSSFFVSILSMKKPR
jgi:hypothetical protein